MFALYLTSINYSFWPATFFGAKCVTSYATFLLEKALEGNLLGLVAKLDYETFGFFVAFCRMSYMLTCAFSSLVYSDAIHIACVAHDEIKKQSI